LDPWRNYGVGLAVGAGGTGMGDDDAGGMGPMNDGSLARRNFSNPDLGPTLFR
jgi:hypothetical protein